MLGLTILSIVSYAVFMGMCFDRNTPYFPIEISRILASGPHAYWSFVIPVIACLPIVPHNLYALLSWICIVGIAVVDDKTSWQLHMLFVAGLMSVAVIKAFASQEQLFIIGMAFFLYAIRIVFKVAAVLLFYNAKTLSDVKDVSIQIMFGTIQPANSAMLLAFQLGGVLQWIVLVLVGSVILKN